MAYKAEIQIGVVGLKQLEEIEKRLTGINSLVTRLNKTAKNPTINVKNITTANNSVSTLNKQLARTLQLQQQINKNPVTPVKPSAGAPSGGRPPSGRPTAGGQGKGADISGAISNAIIGGAFPLLFGQGAGAAVGGAIGGVAGQLALGPAGGFAGSLLGTAVGDMADATSEVKKLAAALDLTGAAADQFGESFRRAGVDLQTFKQAVNTIQGVNVPFEQQATAIKLATNVSANYKGSLAAVASTIQTLGSTGQVNIKTLQTLTAANVPIVQQLATKYGVTKDKIMEMAAEGSISVSELIQELNNLGNQTKPQTAIEKLSEAFSSLTANVLKVFGPVFEGLGDVVIGIVDKISNGFGYVADVIFPQLVAAVSPITQALQEAFPTDVFDEVANFFQSILIKALEGVVFVVGKLSPVVAFIIKKFKELSNNPVFKFIADQVARLANFLGLTNVKVDEYAKRQAAAAANTKATEAEAKKLAAALAAASQAQLQLDQQSLSTRQALVQVEQSRLQRQLEVATSLNQEASLIDALTQKRNESAALELEAARLSAQASIEKAQRDGENVGLAKQLAALNLQAAGAKFQEAQAANQLAGGQAKVAAFAEESARQTERFNQAAQLALNALDNNLKVIDAYSQAQTTINNLEIQSLQNKLAQATSDAERYAIIEDIRQLEISNAAITLQATRAQIAAEVERQRIAMSMAEMKYKELQAQLLYAQSQGPVNQKLMDAVNAQRQALMIAEANYETSQKVANEQYRAADAVYNAAVNAANLKMNLEGSAAAAGAIAGSMERAAAASGAAGGGAGGYLTAENIKNPILRARAEEQIKQIDRTTGIGQGAVFQNLNRRQQVILEYMAMEKKAAKEQNMRSAAEELRNMGMFQFIPPQYRTEEDRTAIFSRYGASGAGKGTSATSPQVNITTGPVMQMGGTNYVTQRDLVSATGEAARKGANMALEMLQNNPAARRRTGVTQ